MAGIHSLAKDVDINPAEILPLDDLRRGLVSSVTFAVCGEVNAGKSTLLNALFGVPMCRTHVVPETTDIRRYVYGEKAADVPLDCGITKCVRPLDFLQDFHPIDTLGLNTADESSIAIMLELLPKADLVLCVLPVENPWGAATWDFLTKIPHEALERFVLVIQRADLRDARDLNVISGHVRDLCVKRLGRGLPVHAVAALDAYEAKRRQPLDSAARKASGMLELEENIGSLVFQSPRRWAMLKEWRDQAANALRKIDERMEDRTRSLSHHSRFLDEIEREIDVIRENFIKRLPHHLAEVADAFEQEAHGVSKILSRRLGVMASILRLFTRGKVAKAIEGLFVERLKSSVETVADADATEVVRFCNSHWKALEPRVEDTLGIRLDGDLEMIEVMKKSREIFVRRLGHAAGEGVGKLNARRHLDDHLRMRNVSLTSFMITTLLLTTAGAVCGALGMMWLPWILCGLALLFLTGGVVAAIVTRRSITRTHRQILVDACGRFAATLKDDYEDAIRLMFRDYTQCLRAVREHLARENLAIEPRQRRWQEMFLHLKAIEQEI